MKIKSAIFVLISISITPAIQAEVYPTEAHFLASVQASAEYFLKANDKLTNIKNLPSSEVVYYYCVRRDYLLKIKNDAEDNLNYLSAYQWRTVATEKLKRDDFEIDKNKFDAEIMCKNI